MDDLNHDFLLVYAAENNAGDFIHTIYMIFNSRLVLFPHHVLGGGEDASHNYTYYTCTRMPTGFHKTVGPGLVIKLHKTGTIRI